jgi:hypothetical protein
LTARIILPRKRIADRITETVVVLGDGGDEAFEDGGKADYDDDNDRDDGDDFDE